MAWTSPRTWVAGEKPTAATLNQHVRDNLKAVGDATAYTPTLTAITLGAGGTANGFYSEAGKWLTIEVAITLGTGGVLTGSPTVTLPTGLTWALAVTRCLGEVTLYDTSGGTRRVGRAMLTGGSTFGVNMESDTGLSAISATVPWTWAVGDLLFFEVKGRIA